MAGFGLGILWVLKDEMENPKIFRIPKAGSFDQEELVQWNQSAGPKGPWAVNEAEVYRMNNTHFVTSSTEKSEPSSNTW